MKRTLQLQAIIPLAAVLFVVGLTPAFADQALQTVTVHKLGCADAIDRLYASLGKVGIERGDITIANDEFSQNKIAIRSSEDFVNIAVYLYGFIDPAPAQKDEILDDFIVDNLSTETLENCLNVRLKSALSYLGGRLCIEQAECEGLHEDGQCENRTQPATSDSDCLGSCSIVNEKASEGWQGKYQYIKDDSKILFVLSNEPACDDGNKQHVIVHGENFPRPTYNWLKSLVTTFDHELGGPATLETVELCYIDVREAIETLRLAGYPAYYNDPATDNNAKSVYDTEDPFIMNAPQIQDTSARLSANPGSSTSSNTDIQGSQFQSLAFTNAVSGGSINSLILRGNPQFRDKVIKDIHKIDVPARTILIEALVIELKTTSAKDLGLSEIASRDDRANIDINLPSAPDTSNPGVAFTYDDALQPAGSFRAILQQLVDNGDATIKACPRVAGLDGRQAVINIAQQVPVVEENISNNTQKTFSVRYIPVGITLNIKPRVGLNNEVEMQVDAVVSNIEQLHTAVLGPVTAPLFNTREISTVARVPDNMSLILGGLISTEHEFRREGIRGLSDLPLIGSLFGRQRSTNERKEIIIVITPHVEQASQNSGVQADAPPNPPQDGKVQADTPPTSVASVDPYLTPPGSGKLLNELDNVMLPAEYRLSSEDIRGINPVDGIPYKAQYDCNSESDPVMLTLRQVVKANDVVRNIPVMKNLTPQVRETIEANVRIHTDMAVSNYYHIPYKPNQKWSEYRTTQAVGFLNEDAVVTAENIAEAILVLYIERINNLVKLDGEQITSAWRELVPGRSLLIPYYREPHCDFYPYPLNPDLDDLLPCLDDPDVQRLARTLANIDSEQITDSGQSSNTPNGGQSQSPRH